MALILHQSGHGHSHGGVGSHGHSHKGNEHDRATKQKDDHADPEKNVVANGMFLLENNHAWEVSDKMMHNLFSWCREMLKKAICEQRFVLNAGQKAQLLALEFY